MSKEKLCLIGGIMSELKHRYYEYIRNNTVVSEITLYVTELEESNKNNTIDNSPPPLPPDPPPKRIIKEMGIKK